MKNMLKALFLGVVVFAPVWPAAANLTIIPKFDTTITSDPNAATIQRTINQAIYVYQARFADPITVYITFVKTNSGLGMSLTRFRTVNYADYLAALNADRTTAADDTAVATLPAGPNNPADGGTQIRMTLANIRAVGGLPGVNADSSAANPDSTIFLNTSIVNLSRASTIATNDDLMSTVMHEIDEVLGTSSGLPTDPAPWPLDLFRYDLTGARTYVVGAAIRAYFSIDGGVTRLVRFNQSAIGDYGDWIVNSPPQVQDFQGTRGSRPDLGVNEITALDVIGYDAVPGTLLQLLGSGSFNLLGSEYSSVETSSTFINAPWGPPPPSDGDLMVTWNVNLQDLNSVISTYSIITRKWDPTNYALPRGKGFFYIAADPDFAVLKRQIDIPPHQPQALAANKYYLLSSTVAQPATYTDLVDDPAAIPNERTFVWPWNVWTQDWDNPYRYSGGRWQPANWTIPEGGGAFVAYFTPGAAPAITNVQTSISCPPNVDLILTFSADMDPFTVTNKANYKIYNADGVSVGGSVGSVSPFPSSAHLRMVQLSVSLLSQAANTYYVAAPNVTSLGGTPSSGQKAFTLCAGPPTNDSIAAAIPLSAGASLAGSLTCASPSSLNDAAQFPPGAGVAARDVWYSYTPTNTGYARISACAACQDGGTVLAAYQAITGGPLIPIQSGLWYGLSTPSYCSGATNGATLFFIAEACTKYYIRVSGRDSGIMSGDFTLSVVHSPAAPVNDNCASPKVVSANSSTRFDNFSATTGPPNDSLIDYDLWFSFQAPPGTGTFSATIETCTANFNTALAVYTNRCPSLPSDLVGFSAGNGCTAANGTAFAFAANAGQNYYIRVGGNHAAANRQGCGFLRVTCGLPPVGTVPPGFPAYYTRGYEILGSPNNIGWSWSLTAPAPCNLNIQGSVGGVASTGTALDIAKAFADSINVRMPSAAFALDYHGTAILGVYTPCSASNVVLKVGPEDGPPACWVDYYTLAVALPPCNFNPTIFQLGDPDGASTDCNGNGQSDSLDILQGISQDVNGNGIPDECEGCIGAIVTNGPDSSLAYLGGPASLAVQAAGSFPFTYQWRKDGAPLQDQTNATLTLAATTYDDAGLYDVIVSNNCGQATSPSVALVVDPTPYLRVAPMGTNIVLSWTADSYHLQMNSSLTDPAGWSDLAGASPVSLPLTSEPRFFRLKSD